MFSSVTVTGPPAAIWRLKIGPTDPDEPSTLPKRTVVKRVWSKWRCAASTAHSASVFHPAPTPPADPPLSGGTSTQRRAHRRPRRHRLVGGHEHEALGTRLARGGRDDARGHGVVAHGLDRVLLHE